MNIDLEYLKKLAKDATPGPWAVDAQDFVIDADGNDIVETLYDNYGNNANYIACASPDVILSMIAKIKQLKAEADWLAEYGAGKEQCPFFEFLYGDAEPIPDWCEGSETAEDGFDCPNDPVECWRKVARKAVRKVQNG